ncbi:MAG: plasmid mobilization relaxosome protein MobC [Phycisphaerales bacterium]
MARPRKQEHERRTASIRADLTEAEKAYIQEQAAKAGLSGAEYTRRRLLGFAVTSPAAARRADPALVTELNRIGVNVNQLARAVHTDRDFARFWREIGQELREVLEKVVKAGEA